MMVPIIDVFKPIPTTNNYWNRYSLIPGSGVIIDHNLKNTSSVFSNSYVQYNKYNRYNIGTIYVEQASSIIFIYNLFYFMP